MRFHLCKFKINVLDIVVVVYAAAPAAVVAAGWIAKCSVQPLLPAHWLL